MRKRPLGQNFLIDTGIADSIIELADIKKEDDILEIGPGKAVLTQRLIPLARSLTAIELDPNLCRELEYRIKNEICSFKIIEGDAAKFDYSFIKPKFKVVSNLPYYACLLYTSPSPRDS